MLESRADRRRPGRKTFERMSRFGTARRALQQFIALANRNVICNLGPFQIIETQKRPSMPSMRQYDPRS